MTLFQRCGMSIVAFGWCKELWGQPTKSLSGYFVVKSLQSGKDVVDFNIKELSLSNVDMEGRDEGSLLKFYSIKNEAGNFHITSEDTPYTPIRIYQIYPSQISGYDPEGNLFVLSFESYNVIKIIDNQNTSKTFKYEVRRR